jgi:phenylacetate-CoA ligase
MSEIGEKIRLGLVLPVAEKLMGTCAMKWYRQIEKMSHWSREDVVNWQNLQLQHFVQHAYDHTVYYRKLFDSLNLKPADITKAEDLKLLPIVNKTIINEHHDEFIPDNLHQFRYRSGKTGGTTGEPMLYLCDENTWGYVTAAKIFHWKKTGYRYGDRFAAMGSSSLFSKKPSMARRIYDGIRREFPMNAVNLTDELCDAYIRTIKSHKIKYLYGYAAALYTFTKYVKNNSVDLTQINAVFSTSENLTDAYRSLMEETYQCKVVDCYGARDAGITAYESERGMYQVGYNVIVEVIDEFEDNTGSLLSTNFLNYSFPLIRYQFGDEVELKIKDDEITYNGQVISRVLGRTSDVMRLGNGHHLTATGFSMIMKEFDVVAFDFKKVGDRELVLRIQPVAGKYSMDQETLIRKTFIHYLGEDAKLNIEYVDKFEPLKNGKRRYFYNE